MAELQVSHLQHLVNEALPKSEHSPQLVHLARSIAYGLEHEHNWTSIHIHYSSPVSPEDPLPRPLVSGLPRAKIYTHPDEQIENLIREKKGEKIDDTPEREWVIPSHLQEKWTLRRLAACFDSVNEEPPMGDEVIDAGQEVSSQQRRGGKRMLLATLGNDSTITYYIVHDGIVKPRQN